MVRFIFYILFCLLIFGCSWDTKFRDDEDFSLINNSKDLIAFVEEAAALVREHGEESFPDFREEDSDWYRGDIYVFIYGIDGKRYVYPLDPKDEGENALNLEDVHGKLIIQQFLEVVDNDKNAGWCHYEWPKIRGGKNAWKSAYLIKVKSPSGKEYIVGSGLYNMKMERELIVDIVNEAVDLIEEKGKEAFIILQDRRNRFFYNNTYVFVMNIDGLELVNSAFPNYVGRNLINIRDQNGTYVVREEIRIAKEKGEGWIHCYWEKFDTGEMTPEYAFVKRVMIGDEMYVVGSALYEY